MSLHSYTSVLRRIDKGRGSVRKFLDFPVHPMELRTMAFAENVPLTVQRGVDELAARTARCYSGFSDPVISRCMRRANAERLKWMQTYSLREFKYCAALHDVLAKTPLSESTRLSSSSDAIASVPLDGVHRSASALASAQAAYPACYLRNTDDMTYVNESAAVAASSAQRNSDCDAAVRTLAMGIPGDRSSSSSSSGGGVTSSSSSTPSTSPGEARASMTREEAELALERGEATIGDIPFDLALELLRPQQSVLDVLVNEAAFHSDHLNGWFSRFCGRRVAWRVLHEHLLHLTRPDVFPPVVCHDTDLIDVLQTAANTVADIYAKLSVSDHELVIHLEEDQSILTSRPEAAYMSSSTDCHITPCSNTTGGGLPLSDAPALVAPPESDTIFSVDGHLAYVFREVLKNSCVATVGWTTDVSVTVRFASDDRWVVVDFVDHAGGISAEHMRNMWKFGWTTSGHYESHFGGFGVGLPTSKVYMDMWGGSIDVFSTVGEGTTVRVRYPKAPKEVLVTEPGAYLDISACSENGGEGSSHS